MIKEVMAQEMSGIILFPRADRDGYEPRVFTDGFLLVHELPIDTTIGNSSMFPGESSQTIFIKGTLAIDLEKFDTNLSKDQWDEAYKTLTGRNGKGLDFIIRDEFEEYFNKIGPDDPIAKALWETKRLDDMEALIEIGGLPLKARLNVRRVVWEIT